VSSNLIARSIFSRNVDAGGPLAAVDYGARPSSSRAARHDPVMHAKEAGLPWRPEKAALDVPVIGQ